MINGEKSWKDERKKGGGIREGGRDLEEGKGKKRQERGKSNKEQVQCDQFT